MPSPAPRAALAAPTPLAPIEGAVVPLDAATFRWSAPPRATSFTLRVAAADAPDDLLFELADLPTTEATVADALPAGPCLWWVRTGDGPWSVPARFVAGTPADVEAAQREAANAARQETVAQREGRRLGGPEPMEEPPEPVWPHASGPALEGAPDLDWSAVPGFEAPLHRDEATTEAEPPAPQAPLGGEVVDAAAIALRWAPVPGATGYDVELSPHAAFDRDVLTLDAGAATEVALPGVVPATGHRLLWRVRARTAADPTRWSRYGRFYPALGAPVDQFREGLDAARAAVRKRRDYERRVRERELALVPFHERDDAVTDRATLTVLIGMMLSGIVVAVLTLVFSLLRF
jgi:hypothetical protein